MGHRVTILATLLSLAATEVTATIPLSPHPTVSFLAIEDGRQSHRMSYVFNERHDEPAEGSEIGRERVSNGLWYQFQAGNGFRFDASLQHIHESLSDASESTATWGAETARFGTGLSGGLGWSLSIHEWRDEARGWRGAVGAHLGGAGFFSREGDRFAPFAGGAELRGYTASAALGVELHKASAGIFRDLAGLLYLEAFPLVHMESKDLPPGSFEDNPESDNGLGWVRLGVSLQFNWSDENPTPVVMSVSQVFSPVAQQTLGVGLAF